MINIPTELLRTFVAVVDLRSFTKAAQSLGVTQPAVSAQIKRLQQLLGGDLMDKSAAGVALTPMGGTVLAYGRRLLAINDQILSFTGPPAVAPHAIRVGMPGDFVGAALWRTLRRFRGSRPDIRFHVKSGPSESLARDMREGGLDVALTVSGAAPRPPLPKIVCNVCVRAGADDVVDQFARALADAFGVRAAPGADRQDLAAR